jgi:hypothetical protein
MRGLLACALFLSLPVNGFYHLTEAERQEVNQLNGNGRHLSMCTSMTTRTPPASVGRKITYVNQGSCGKVISPIPTALSHRFNINTSFYRYPCENLIILLRVIFHICMILTDEILNITASILKQ